MTRLIERRPGTKINPDREWWRVDHVTGPRTITYGWLRQIRKGKYEARYAGTILGTASTHAGAIDLIRSARERAASGQRP